MDRVVNDWLVGEAWNCKPTEKNDPGNHTQAVLASPDAYTKGRRPCTRNTLNTASNETSRAINPKHSNTDKAPRLVEEDPIKYQWPGGLPPRQPHGYSDDKAFHMLFRVIINLTLVGALLYATISLAAYPNVATDYDSCLSTASWFESRFFINVVVRNDLSFTQAKLIDLAWDTIVGQGLRVIHAWWLYQVATHVVTYCLETSGLPYDFLLSLLFQSTSVSSLMAALRMTFGQSWRICRLYCAWLSFAIGYILLFPTIWAACTGYASPSITAYNLNDMAYVPIKSEELNLCWVTKDPRIPKVLDSIVMGPSFPSLYKFDPSQVPDGTTPWKLPENSSDFTDLFSYAKTKHSLQNYFHSFNALKNTTNVITSHVNLTANYYSHKRNWTDWRSPFTYIEEHWDGLFFYTNQTTRNVWQAPPLPEVLIGSQFLRRDKMFLQDAVFHRNNTGLHEITINDTIYLLSLYTPRFSILGPPTKSIAHGGSLVLGSAPVIKGSRWGQTGPSRTNTHVSARREITWIIGCWVIRWHTTVSSNLIDNNRRNVGTVRHILDLAEAMNRDLGPNTCVYSDDELHAALQRCPPVGYEIESKDGLKHIGLVTVHRGSHWRKRIDFELDDTYG
ncbi:hypothetical protein NPX13_g5851 [Xylaria arbuscula]|uniref:Uncharacterized protein n=1 Tax=Xylaria arbuscula TaxID=114810 RepID=A0A9W8TMC0_9PEZI|nr:hypothetical protein NPX13_g5851 [Xylaria arbuscula]